MSGSRSACSPCRPVVSPGRSSISRARASTSPCSTRRCRRCVDEQRTNTGQSVEGGQRWGQLTYTVVDSTRAYGDGGPGGGCQVKRAGAGLRPDEQERMLRATASVLLPPKGLPRFPSEAEITELPV